MKTIEDYKFTVSLSSDKYFSKDICSACLGITKGTTSETKKKARENRRIRKENGYKTNSGIGFKETTTTINGLVDYLVHGGVYCNLFTPESTRKDNCFTMSEKTSDNFKGSYLITLDIDETNYPNVDEFVSKLKLVPSFWYTTYSNLQSGKGARFRIGYVLDNIIQGRYQYRYVADCLNKLVESWTGEEIHDKCNLSCSQYFNGTCIDNPDLICTYGTTNNIYSIYDFNATVEGFGEYLNNYCGYKTKDSKRTAEIKELLTKYYNVPEYVNPETGLEITIDENLVKDMTSLDWKEFTHYYSSRYEYFSRKEDKTWQEYEIEGEKVVYQQTSEDFLQIHFPKRGNKLHDGEERRKNLYRYTSLRRLINPSAKPELLLWCSYLDRAWYVDNSDGIVTVDELVKIVKSTLSKTIEELKEENKYILDKAKKNRPKFILHKDQENKTSVQRKLTGLWNMFEINKYYDKTKSVKENIELLKDKGIEVKRDSIYKYLNMFKIDKKGVKENKKLQEHIRLEELYNPELSINKNLEVLKGYGMKISKGKLVKWFKECYVPRPNKSYSWIENHYSEYLALITEKFYKVNN